MHPFKDNLIRPLRLELPSGDSVEIPRCRVFFTPWRGEPIVDTFGGKPVLALDGEPLFAELVILRKLQVAGWDGVWVAFPVL